MPSLAEADDPTTLTLPRILCLHGGGVNGVVFRKQCRSLLKSRLSSRLRFVFVDGPFPCDAHPAIAPVYGADGPFFRWLRWLPEHDDLDAQQTAREVLDQVRAGMDGDAGTGAWVGVLGFSQGAKLAASLLWTQQHVGEAVPMLPADVRFRFGVFLAGSGPPVMLDPNGVHFPLPRHVATAEGLSLAFKDWPAGNEGKYAIEAPTLHVHGLRDQGLEGHRRLYRLYARPGTARLMEWDGDHRIPLKTVDVERLVQGILELAEVTGSLG